MKRTIDEFVEHMVLKKKISKNTQEAYKRDLHQMMEYFYMHKIIDYQAITETNLNSYILHLELKGLSNASVVRNIASIKGYFDYLFKTKAISDCITDDLKRPMVETKRQGKTKKDDVEAILDMMKEHSPKVMRDKAILLLLCTPGIQASEMLNLEIDDVDLNVGFVTCSRAGKQKMIRIDERVKQAVKEYLEDARQQIVKTDTNLLFPNMRGTAMSRQGVWKILKKYGAEAGVNDLSPRTLSGSLKLQY